MKALLESRTVRILTFIVITIGVLIILISLLLLGLSALAYLGVLADVGPEENREMGIQLLSLGIPPLIFGVLVFVLGLIAFVRNRKRDDQVKHCA